MSIPDIRSLLPHSGPMVLLDRVIAADEESLCAEVRIRENSLFCNADGVGAWVGLEYMAQAIGAGDDGTEGDSAFHHAIVVAAHNPLLELAGR